MTPDQMSALFTNMSTQAMKAVASNHDVIAAGQYGLGLLFGLTVALILAVTWKG